MSFVSPRKLERIQRYDVLFHDILFDPDAICEFCDLLDLNQSTKQSLIDELSIIEKIENPQRIRLQNEGPSFLQEFCDYILLTVKSDTERVCSLHQQELNRYFSSIKKKKSDSQNETPKRKIRPSLCAESVPFVPSRTFGLNSTNSPDTSFFPDFSNRFRNDSVSVTATKESSSTLHRLELSPPTTPPRQSIPPPSTPPRRHLSPLSTPPRRSLSPPTTPSRQSLPPPSTPPRRHLSPPSTPPRMSFSSSTTPPRKVRIAPSTQSSEPLALPLINSVSRVSLATLTVPPLITNLSVLLSAILLSPYSKSFLQDLQLFIKFLGCGMRIDYATTANLASIPPWNSLHDLSIPCLIDPTHCFELAVSVLNHLSGVLVLFPKSSVSLLMDLEVLTSIQRDDLPSYEESIPQEVFSFHTNFTFNLQRQINESKQQSISRDSILLYNNRQKTLDWFMTLLRNYELCSNQVSLANLESFQKQMSESIHSALIDRVNSENLHYLAQILVNEYFNTTIPSEIDLFLQHNQDTQFFQTVYLRMFQQNGIPTGENSCKSIEELINSVFPGKQGFFALFLYYGDCHDFNCFVINELTRVIVQLVEIMQDSSNSLLHSLIISRTFVKLLGFLVFAPFWKLCHSPLAIDGDSSFFVPIPFSLMEWAQDAWDCGHYELFLAWIGSFFYFLPREILQRSSQLKSFFRFVGNHFVSMKQKTPSVASLAITIGSEQLLQIVHLPFSSLPLSHIDSLSYHTTVPTSLSLFLLQAFYPDFSSLTTTITTISKLFTDMDDPSTTPSYSFSARKIRPRDMEAPFPKPVEVNTIGLNTAESERSHRLLKKLAKQNARVYGIVEKLTEVLLEYRGKEIITVEYCNEIIRDHYDDLKEMVKLMYAGVKQDSLLHVVDSAAMTPTSPEPLVLQLQSSTECVVVNEAMDKLHKVVLDDLIHSLQNLRLQKLSTIWSPPVFSLLIKTRSYVIVRDIVHSVVSHMFEEARKLRNLLLIQEQHSSTEIARGVDLHNQDTSTSSYSKLVVTVFTEIPKLVSNYKLIETNCYSFVNREEWNEKLNQYFGICCDCLHSIYLHMNEDYTENVSFHYTVMSWIGKLPTYNPSDLLYGRIMKEFCRIVLRFHRTSHTVISDYPYQNITVETILHLDSDNKRKALSIFLLYLLKPGYMNLEELSSFVHSLWNKVIIQGEEECVLMTKWIISLLTVYNSDLFKEVFPSFYSHSFLYRVIDAVLSYWEGKSNDDIHLLYKLNKCIFIL